MVKGKKAAEEGRYAQSVETLAENWKKSKKANSFDGALVDHIYKSFLAPSIANADTSKHALSVLDATGYLEHYLWPHFNGDHANEAHIISIITLANEKTNMDWAVHEDKKLSSFVDALLRLKHTNSALGRREHARVFRFLANGIRHLEIPHVAKSMLLYTSLPVWKHLSDVQRANLFEEHPKLKRHWQNRQSKASSPVVKKRKIEHVDLESDFYPRLVQELKEALEVNPDDDVHGDVIHYIAHALELWIDLMSQLPTRRFLRALVLHLHLLMACRHSEIVKKHPIVVKQVELLHFYVHFPIDDQTGHAWTIPEHKNELAARAHAFQVQAFSADPALQALSLLPLSSLSNRSVLQTQLSLIPEEILYPFAQSIGLIQPTDENVDVVDCFIDRFAPILPPALIELPRFPIETDIWSSDSTFDGILATRKMHLQFLSLTDFLYRNFELIRLDAAHSIRNDLESVLGHVGAKVDRNRASFSRRHKMAAALESIKVVRVDQPSIGELHPAQVVAQVTLDLPQEFLREWDSIQPNEVVFLVWLNPPNSASENDDSSLLNFAEVHGVHGVRGAHVLQILDGHGTAIGEILENGEVSVGKGTRRVLRVALDGAQYAKDVAEGATDVLTKVNVVVRRDPKVNKFKSILDSIHQMLRSQNVHKLLPSWLEDVFLGYGDPAAAHHSRLEPNVAIPLYDTFVDGSHALSSFTGKVTLVDSTSGKAIKDASKAIGPFSLTEKEDGSFVIAATSTEKSISKEANAFRFTNAQVEAISSGMHRGLTVVAGPPGTGKTDVAVQLASNLYRAHPEQRIVVVAQTNGALDDFFTKLVARGIVDPGHLLRLGDNAVSNSDDASNFTKDGRVAFLLSRRLLLLQQVEQLAATLGGAAATCGASHSCSQAQFFYTKYLQPALETPSNELLELLKTLYHSTNIKEVSPYLDRLFKELADLSAFEVLRTSKQRGDYLLVKHAKVIAMTCTHAAFSRERFISLGFHFNTLLMEEAAQVNEIESFLPLVLQPQSDKYLERIVLFGDHEQLPPIVSNGALQKYAKLDQSLFTRLVRLGAPLVRLDRQGRSRASLAKLFQWKYKDLKHLEHVSSSPEFNSANAGFHHPCQFIDVPGGSEVSSRPQAFENHLEAMYIVQVYQYMCRLGYSPERIAVLTTYNAQRDLLVSMFQPGKAEFGLPQTIATVDQYQGQQNDFVLLSLVRTKDIGHIRDPRRAVVAVSRARLGLYIFGKKTLFSTCVDLAPILTPLFDQSSSLELVPTERAASCSRQEKDKVKDVEVVANVQHMGEIVAKLTK